MRNNNTAKPTRHLCGLSKYGLTVAVLAPISVQDSNIAQQEVFI